MCFFLAVQLKNNQTKDDLELPEGIALNDFPIFKVNTIDQDRKIAFLTTGMCSCSLVDKNDGDEFNRRIEKYKKAGWSKAKIERAISEHSSTQKRKTDNSISAQFKKWIKRYSEKDKDIAFFIHWATDNFPEKITTTIINKADIESLALIKLTDTWIKLK